MSRTENKRPRPEVVKAVEEVEAVRDEIEAMPADWAVHVNGAPTNHLVVGNDPAEALAVWLRLTGVDPAQLQNISLTRQTRMVT